MLFHGTAIWFPNHFSIFITHSFASHFRTQTHLSRWICCSTAMKFSCECMHGSSFWIDFTGAFSQYGESTVLSSVLASELSKLTSVSKPQKYGQYSEMWPNIDSNTIWSQLYWSKVSNYLFHSSTLWCQCNHMHAFEQAKSQSHSTESIDPFSLLCVLFHSFHLYLV